MRVSLPVWNGRLSPVFDVAERFVVVDVEGGSITRRSEHSFPDSRRVADLWKLGVDVVICGAVSRQLEATLRLAGIDVVSEICGPTDSVIDAFVRGALPDSAFLSPCHPGRVRHAASLAPPRGLVG